jgi:hypothetical protein
VREGEVASAHVGRHHRDQVCVREHAAQHGQQRTLDPRRTRVVHVRRIEEEGDDAGARVSDGVA